MIVIDWFDLVFIGVFILLIIILPFVCIIDKIAFVVSKRQQKKIDEAFKDEAGERMTELKPCPFCGRTGTLFVENDEIGWVSVVCSPSDHGCGATGPAKVDEEDAREAWNRRVEDG